MNLSSPLTVLYNRETRVETCFERVPAPERAVDRRPIRKGQSARRLWLARKDLATHYTRSRTVGF